MSKEQTNDIEVDTPEKYNEDSKLALLFMLGVRGGFSRTNTLAALKEISEDASVPAAEQKACRFAIEVITDMETDLKNAMAEALEQAVSNKDTDSLAAVGAYAEGQVAGIEAAVAVAKKETVH